MISLAKELSLALPLLYKQALNSYNPSAAWDTGLKQSYALQSRYDPVSLLVLHMTVVLPPDLLCWLVPLHMSATNHEGKTPEYAVCWCGVESRPSLPFALLSRP